MTSHNSFPQSPVKARHAEPSMVFSADDDRARPSERLFSLSAKLIEECLTVDLSDISYRMSTRPFYPDIWPGEHYKLLAGMIKLLQPGVVIEIGTAEGLSALSMKKYLPSNGRVHTFDIRPWRTVPNAVLIEDDFTDGRLLQHNENLELAENMDKYRAIIESADIIFVDAAKDGIFEDRFLQNLEQVKFNKPPLIVFDDIRLWNMLAVWRDIKRPKLDFTSFGHWSGTGIVDWIL